MFTPSTLVLTSVTYVPPVTGVPQFWAYSTSDTIATVSASDYFDYSIQVTGYNPGIRIGDSIYCVCSNGVVQLTVSTLTPHFTTTALTVAANSVNTAAIQNGAVGSAQVAANLIQYATVTGISPLTLFSAGTQLLPAPGAGLVILPLNLDFNYLFATAQFTAGGAIGVQYGSNTGATGEACSATLPAATLNGYTANEVFELATAVSGLSSNAINKPLYITCATANFATGAGTLTAYVSYIIVPAS